ncbi:MAG: aminomethyltransferase family protein [Planctomycetota bacterium]|jgi:aminomethyltransferase|nr:aminomethyltransferase family protein [Planctomycetota bacterium]
MPLPSPFHQRTSELCTSLLWKEWAGYYAVCSYGMSHEPEYHAVRQSAGMLDVSPLYKFDVIGPDATEFLAFVSARNVGKLKLGQVGYGCWCDEHGKVLDDGTVTRWGEQAYRVTSADPSYAWFSRHSRGFDVQVKDVSSDVAALALQGPRARQILEDVCDGGDVGDLRFFYGTHSKIAGVRVDVTRTGYTGDLGYELWMPAQEALKVWDAVMEAGKPHAMLPLGLDALDVCRVEAGFILLGVDYFSARRCMTDVQKSTPYELGLGWTVHTKRGPFLGRDALRREKSTGSVWALVGLVVDWDELEGLYNSFGLPPQLSSHAWRTAVPVYDQGSQVGQATSGGWSPILKKNLALASVHAAHAVPGKRLQIEVTVEFQRRKVSATVTETPFFNPDRKRA